MLTLYTADDRPLHFEVDALKAMTPALSRAIEQAAPADKEAIERAWHMVHALVDEAER